MYTHITYSDGTSNRCIYMITATRDIGEMKGLWLGNRCHIHDVSYYLCVLEKRSAFQIEK